MLRSSLSRLGAVLLPALTALVIHACSDATGPSGGGLVSGPRVSLSLVPSFQTVAGGGIVDVQTVRIVIRRADGSIALETDVTFPAGQDEIALNLDVPLSPNAPPSGEEFTLNLEMRDGNGQVVFRGGPVAVRATQGTPLPPVPVPTVYTGTGANATRVELSPTTATAAPGQTVSYTATAFGADNQPIAGTPIVFSSTTPPVATVANPAVGQVVAVGRGQSTITARLLTGPSAEATLTVVPPATALAATAGGAQTGTVGTALGQPLQVRVTAADGLGVGGVAVTFSTATTGATLGSTEVLTDADGVAQTTLTLPTVPGAVSVTATAAGLADASVTFTATAHPGTAQALRFETQPVGGVSGAVLAPFTVEARDAFDNLATGFNGTVTLTLQGGAAVVLDGETLAEATLAGTSSVQAVEGVARFDAVRIDGAGTGVQLSASATGVTSASSSAPFSVTPLPATATVITTQPQATKTLLPTTVAVEARTASGSLASTYVGTLLVSLNTGPQGGTLLGTLSAPFVNGVATVQVAASTPGSYTLTLQTSGFPDLVTEPFLVVTPEPASVELVSLPSIAAPGSQVNVEVRVRDGGNDLVAAAQVDWSVLLGGGTVSAPYSLTGEDGIASVVWTVGVSGTQQLRAVSGSAPALDISLPLSAPTATTWTGLESADWFTAANWTPAVVPTATTDVTIPASATAPQIANGTATARHLTLAPNAELFTEYYSSQLQLTGNLTLGAGARIAELACECADGVASDRRSSVLTEGGYNDGEISFVGPGTQSIGMGAGARIEVRTYVLSTVLAATDLTFAAPLNVLTANGLFDVNGRTVSVTYFETSDGGRLKMQSASGLLTVRQWAYFYGGSTVGLLTAGELRVLGGLDQFGGSYGGGDNDAPPALLAARATHRAATQARTATREQMPTSRLPRASVTDGRYAYATSGTHLTRMLCAPESPYWNDTDGGYCTSSSLYLENPDESRLARLTLDGPGGWSMYQGVHVTGDLTLQNGAFTYGGGYDEVAADGRASLRQSARRVLTQRAAQRADVPTSRMAVGGATARSCRYKICVDGVLTGTSTEYLYADVLDLTGSLQGELGVDTYTLALRGTNQTLSQVSTPNLYFTNLDVLGTTALVSGETVQLGGYGQARVLSNGVLDVNGATLDIGYTGTLYTADAGVVVMDDPDATIIASNANFFGGASTLTAGTLRLGNSFTQGGTPNAFAASGTHTVLFGSTANYGAISFDTPGPGAEASHFANLRFDGGSSITLTSAVFVNGTFSVDDNVGGLSITGSAFPLTVGGVNIPGVGTTAYFDRTPLYVGSTGPLVLNNAVFQSFTAAEGEDQLRIARNGGTFTLDGITFATPCAETWLYVAAIASPGAPTLNFTNLTWPGGCAEKVSTQGGAVVNGFGGGGAESATWTGAVSTNWMTASNWSSGAVPTATTAVTIASGTPFAPRLAAAAAIRSLLVQSGATLTLGSDTDPDDNESRGDVVIGEHLTVTAGGVVTGSGQEQIEMIGTNADLSLQGTQLTGVRLYLSGTVRAVTGGAAFDVYVTGTGRLDLNGQALSVTNEFATVDQGVLRSVTAGGVLTVRTRAVFAGGSTAGELNAGALRVHGELRQQANLWDEGGGDDRLPAALAADRGLTRMSNVSWGSKGDRRSLRTAPGFLLTLVCDATSPGWTGNSCSATDVIFETADSSSVAAIRFDGPGNWRRSGPDNGLRVTGTMEMANGARFFDYEPNQVTEPSAELPTDRGRQREPGPRVQREGASDEMTCRRTLCIEGTLQGSANERVDIGLVALTEQSAISGGIPVRAQALLLSGTGQTFSRTAMPSLGFEYVQVLGSVSLVPGETLTIDGAYPGLDVTGNGVLTLNGAAVALAPGSVIQTYDNGRILMGNPQDRLEATFFYLFGGPSVWTDGMTRVGAEFQQFDGGATPAAVQASGAHRLRFARDASVQNWNNYFLLYFENPGVPGSGSHLATVEVAERQPSIAFQTNMYLTGALRVADGLDPLTITRGCCGPAGRILSVAGLDVGSSVTGVTFERVGFTVRAGSAPLALNNATFTGWTSGDILTLQRNTGSYAFGNVTFADDCTGTQRFLVADAQSGSATYTFTGSSVGCTEPERVVASGGAVITGLGAGQGGGAESATWTGAVSDDWGVAENWSTGTVPSEATAVTIPAGTTNAPVLRVAASAASLTLAPSAVLRLSATSTLGGVLTESSMLTVYGDVTLGADARIARAGSGTNFGRTLFLAGTTSTITAGLGAALDTVQLYVEAATTLASDLRGWTLDIGGLRGHFDVNGRTLELERGIYVFDNGRLQMTTPGGHLIARGNNGFFGASTKGWLTEGTLSLGGWVEIFDGGGMGADRMPRVGLRTADARERRDWVNGPEEQEIAAWRDALRSARRAALTEAVALGGRPLPRLASTDIGDTREAFNPTGNHVTRFFCDETVWLYWNAPTSRCGDIWIYNAEPDFSVLANVVVDKPHTRYHDGVWELGLRVAGELTIQDGATLADFPYGGSLNTAWNDSVAVRVAEFRLSGSVTSCRALLCVDGRIRTLGTADSISTRALHLTRSDISADQSGFGTVFLAGPGHAVAPASLPSGRIRHLLVGGEATVPLSSNFTTAQNGAVRVVGGGTLRVDGILSIGNATGADSLETATGGSLTMTDANAVITTGHAVFGGVPGDLSSGTLRVFHGLRQRDASAALQPSGTHVVELPATGGQPSIQLDHPTGATGSYIHNLRLAGAELVVSLNSDLRVTGLFSVPSGLGNVTLRTWDAPNRALTLSNTNVPGVATRTSFNDIRVVLTASAGPLAFNNIGFDGLPSATDITQLTLLRTSGTWPLDEVEFNYPCSWQGQFVTASGGATYNFTNAMSPCTDLQQLAAKVTTTGGAVVTGLGAGSGNEFAAWLEGRGHRLRVAPVDQDGYSSSN